MAQSLAELRILSVDIGGSNIKATVLNNKGELQVEYQKTPTPSPADPDSLINALKGLIRNFPEFDRVSVGFPGYVRNGVVMTAPNLGTQLWAKTDLVKKLEKALGKPTRVVNDADMQGLGVVDGKGFEIVITLGTGFGTAVLLNGQLLPHLELAHHPVTKNSTYDDYIGEKALEKEGAEKWNKRMKKVLGYLKTVFNYDTLYIGGGNSNKLNFTLDSNIKIVSNKDGIKGGVRLWTNDDKL